MLTSRCAMWITGVLLAGLLASPLFAQVRSSQRIPIKKEKPHVDSVRIHDTITVVVRRTDTVHVSFVDTLRLVRVDTLVDSTCVRGVIPIPIPIRVPRRIEEAAGVTVTPEPATVVLVGSGLVGVAAFSYWRRR